MRRVVSIFLPHWSTDRLRRKTAQSPPDGAPSPGQPLATAIPVHGRRVIAAVDAAARGLGVTPGMTVTRARTIAPGLQVVDAEPDADAEGLRRLALWTGTRYSPLVAPDPPDGVWLDVTGCASLFSTERALLKDLHRRTTAFGLTVQIAVADTAGCAHAVARHVPAGRPVTVEPGCHREAIALLPIAALRLDAQTVDALRKLGFERIEQLIGAPRPPLAKRFGRGLHRRLDQALGHVHEPIEPVFPDHLPRARRGFMEPIATPEAFGRVGLWRQSAEWGDVYSGVMTDCNEAIRPVHDRMPVLLEPHEYDQWLHGTLDDALAFQNRCFPDELIGIERTTELWARRSAPSNV